MHATLVKARYPIVKACVSCDLVTDKIVDGIARLITKSDIERMKSNESKNKTLEAERLIEHGWKKDSQSG